MPRSWILLNYICQDCEFEIVVTQGKIADYIYYCSNPDCPDHIAKEDIGDQEECSFTKRVL